MSTRVVITGTGIPAPLDPRRAGPGVFVCAEGPALQFDAGRATTLRVASLGMACTDLTAVFLTHHHSDHLIGLDDIVMTRWFDDPGPGGTLPIICPEGPCVRFCQRMLDPWEDDLAVRQANELQPSRPTAAIGGFTPSPAPRVVWTSGPVSVQAVTVHHEPVVPSVAYRVSTPSGDVAISGDTRVCAEFARLAEGADIIVHEALSKDLLPDDPAWQPIIAYHADARQLGEMAGQLNTPVLVLTHLCPPPSTEEEEEEEEELYADSVRRGGFKGELVVARDLDSVTLTASEPHVDRRQSRLASA